MSEGQRGGRVVAGRYHLIAPIGRGGMGVVWSAHDELLDRTVAVKEVRYASVLGDEVQVLNRRTLREARAAARLAHPNVIVVHDVIEEDGRPWIVMQLVQSRSLGRVIREDGTLLPRQVAKIGLEVADALRSAHRAGVLHRDVKPENVLLADDGRVVLTDFGIATLEAETSLTMTGLAGTPAFIAPERLKGRPARRESDLWSLGATLYAALEGRPPHDRGTAMATMHSVLNDPPDPAPHAGPMRPVIEGLLAKEPVQRLSHDEAAEMMEQIIADDSPGRLWSAPFSPARRDPAAPDADRRGPVKPPETGLRAEPPARPPSGKEPGAPAVRRRPPYASPPKAPAEPVADVPEGQVPTAKVARPERAAGPGTSPERTAPADEPRAAEKAARTGHDERADAAAAAKETGRADRSPQAEEPARADGGDPAAAPERAGDPPGDERQAAAVVAAEAADDHPGSAADSAPDLPPPTASAPGSGPDRDPGPTPAPGSGPDQDPGPTPAFGSGPDRDHEPASEPAPPPVPESRAEPAPDAESARDAASEPDPVPAPVPGRQAAFGQGPGPTRVSGSVPGADGPDDRPAWPIRKAIPALAVATLIIALLAAWLGMRSASDTGPPAVSEATGHPSAASGNGDPDREDPPSGTTGDEDAEAGEAEPAGDGGKGDSERKDEEDEPAKDSGKDDAKTGKGDDKDSPPKDGGQAALPKGWRLHKDPLGFSVGLPKGWSPYRRSGLSVWFRGPGTAPGSYLLIQEASKTQPDPVADWFNQEQAARNNFRGYQRIRIEGTDYMKAAADWEFTWQMSSGRARVLNRGFLTHTGRGYALYWHTRADAWKKDFSYFETFAATFTPAKKKSG